MNKVDLEALETLKKFGLQSPELCFSANVTYSAPRNSFQAALDHIAAMHAELLARRARDAEVEALVDAINENRGLNVIRERAAAITAALPHLHGIPVVGSEGGEK